MRSSCTLLVLLVFSSVLIQQASAFTFPRLEFSKLKEEAKKTGRRLIDKFTFIKWIVDFFKGKTNTRKDITSMITSVTQKYFGSKKVNDIDADQIQTHEGGFTNLLNSEINLFQEFLINIYGIDKTDTDFINHIKSDPDKYFLNYDAYNLLKGVDIASILTSSTSKITDNVKQKIQGALSDLEL